MGAGIEMFLITLGVAVNLYVIEPLHCVTKLFCWPGVTNMINRKTEGEHSNPEHTEAVISAVSEVIKNLDVQKEGGFVLNNNINSNNNNNNKGFNNNINAEDSADQSEGS